MGLYDLKYKLKNHLSFNKKEIRNLIITIIIGGIIFSFNDWGNNQVNITLGIKNLIISLIATTITVLTYHLSQRLRSVKIGFRPRYNIWWPGIITSLLLVIVSNGIIKAFLIGGISTSLLARQRIQEINYWEETIISLTGPIATTILALIAKTALLITNTPLLKEIMLISITLSISSMIPLPKLPGMKTLFNNRLTYTFVTAWILGTAILIYLVNIIWVILGALTLAVITLTTYYIQVEQEWLDY